MQIPERQTRSDFYNRQSNPQLRRSPSGIAVAKHLGTEHTELYVSPEQALQVIPRLPAIYDEPFRRTIRRSQPNLLSQLTRQYVTVGLPATAETRFRCYNAMLEQAASGRRSAGCPESLRRGAAAAITNIPAPVVDAACFETRGPFCQKTGSTGSRLPSSIKLAGILGSRDLASFYYGTTSHWLDPASVAVDAVELHRSN